ncbi:MAG: hypothetical protein CBC35_02415 [Planctomycetes bacterium TMED75]|nr:hypothetical protein [Planctomycetaceae bacterium]OUU95852.1 MAG: hypothetical protein CBC35_02415 [Planctomycetes bacterium TMED75]
MNQAEPACAIWGVLDELTPEAGLPFSGPRSGVLHPVGSSLLGGLERCFKVHRVARHPTGGFQHQDFRPNSGRKNLEFGIHGVYFRSTERVRLFFGRPHPAFENTQRCRSLSGLFRVRSFSEAVPKGV